MATSAPAPGKPLYGSSLEEYIYAKSSLAGLDPQAVLGVAKAEGGFYGAVGDQGTSFGPFQLHQGGALPSSVPLSAGVAGWGNTTQGIDYALSRIGMVAHNQTGETAISNIVLRFERPKDPSHDLSTAATAYGTFGAAGQGTPSGTTPTGVSGSGLPPLEAAGIGGGLGKILTQIISGGAIPATKGSPSITSLAPSVNGLAGALGLPSIPANPLVRGAEIVGGAVLILVGVIMVGLTAGKPTSSPTAAAAGAAGTVAKVAK